VSRSQPVTHTHHEYLAQGAAAATQAASPAQQVLASLGYIGVIFFAFLPALVIYLGKGRSAPYLRYHSARAVNVSLTLLMFDVCALIVGAMLALDAVSVSLSIVVPIVTVLWLVVLGYVLRAASAAVRGESYELPHWLCPDLVR